jgi:hypothetical protein
MRNVPPGRLAEGQRPGAVWGFKPLGVKDLGVKDLGVKDLGVKDLGVKDLGVKDLGVKDLGVKDLKEVHEWKEMLHFWSNC